MALINNNQYGQDYKFGFLASDAPTIGSGMVVRQAEMRLAPEQVVEGYNVEGHCVAVAASKPDRRKILGTFTGYIRSSFSVADIPAMFSFNSRVFMVHDIGDVRRKGEFNEVTVEAHSFYHINSAGPSATTNDFNYYGLTNFLEDQGRLTTDIFGLQTCTARFKYPAGIGFIGAPSLFDPHPNYSWLHLEHQEIDVAPGFTIFTNGYAGIAGGLSESTPIYEMSLGVSEEQIQLHPKFITSIGGRPSAPLNGAIFVDFETGKKTTDDARGVFQEFLGIVGGERNLLGGISAFLSPNEFTWRERKVSNARPFDVSQVGYISTPVGPAPSVNFPRNWLYMGVSYEQRGLSYFINREWRASGRNGWNQIIYTP